MSDNHLNIKGSIIHVRGQPVILAHDLAKFYESSVREINQYRVNWRMLAIAIKIIAAFNNDFFVREKKAGSDANRSIKYCFSGQICP